MVRVTLTCPDLDNPALAARWEALASASAAPPFRTWAWVGCLAQERYPDPVLAEVHDGPTLIGLALYNRRRDRLGRALHLHESGDRALDGVFTEHNGPLAAPGREREVLIAILRRAGRTVLSGLDDAGLAAARAAGGIVGPLQTRTAPFATLDTGAATYLESLSRNTRGQVRRSDRAFAAAGPLRVTRAATAAQALEWLERLLALHVVTWRARGIESGFATEPVQRFHRALIGRGMDMIDMLQVTAGPRTVGYLYNLRGGGRVCVYQSGFDYTGTDAAEKPGLTCHMAALEHAQAEGAREYDFLAGDSQYKRSLSNGARDLHWFGWQPLVSVAGLAALARRVLRR